MILFVTAEYHDVVKQPGIAESLSVTQPIATSDRNELILGRPKNSDITNNSSVRTRYQPFVVAL